MRETERSGTCDEIGARGGGADRWGEVTKPRPDLDENELRIGRCYEFHPVQVILTRFNQGHTYLGWFIFELVRMLGWGDTMLLSTLNLRCIPFPVLSKTLFWNITALKLLASFALTFDIVESSYDFTWLDGMCCQLPGQTVCIFACKYCLLSTHQERHCQRQWSLDALRKKKHI